MFKMKLLNERINDVQRENERLRAELVKANAIIEYLSMMTDVEIPEETEDDDNAQPEI